LDANDAEDDVDKEDGSDDGWHCDSAAVVAADTEASVNAARVSVRLLTLCSTASHQ